MGDLDDLQRILAKAVQHHESLFDEEYHKQLQIAYSKAYAQWGIADMKKEPPKVLEWKDHGDPEAAAAIGREEQSPEGEKTGVNLSTVMGTGSAEIDAIKSRLATVENELAEQQKTITRLQEAFNILLPTYPQLAEVLTGVRAAGAEPAQNGAKPAT